MNAIFRRIPILFVLLSLMLALAGCATQKIDWTERTGHYTYDQAVIELGPPDKKEKLQDGTLVAEWLTRHASVYSVPESSPYWWHGPFYPQVETSPNWYLRLIFASDGQLKDWKNFAK